MKFENTIDLMLSQDFQARFKAEYWQTKIRYERLHKMVVRYEAGKLNFEPKCSLELFKQQKSAMGQYLYFLEVRALIEDVDLGQEG